MNTSKSVQMISKEFYKSLIMWSKTDDMYYKGSKEFIIRGKAKVRAFSKLFLLLEVESLNGKMHEVVSYTNKDVESFDKIEVDKRVIRLGVVGVKGSDKVYLVNSTERFKALLEVKKLIKFWITHLAINFGIVVLIIILLYNVVFWIALYCF